MSQAVLYTVHAEAGGQAAPQGTSPWGEIETPARDFDPEISLYRDRTVALLRRYLRLSIEVGRLPSIMGRQCFRARISFYQAATFEDTIIFVHDVERALERLDGFEQKLISAIVLQNYSQDEVVCEGDNSE